MPSLNTLAAQPFDDDLTFADVVHFVHINGIEPHPMGPDVSPYGGRVSESRHSTVLQPTTYDERVEVARGINALLEDDQLLLVDELSPGSSVDVIWCTYDTAPNSAFLIRQDGIVEVVQLWLNTGTMEQAIRELIGDHSISSRVESNFIHSSDGQGRQGLFSSWDHFERATKRRPRNPYHVA